ncbi:hypothetical protein ACUYMX_005990, partial [Escherichia coli]
ETMIWQPEFTDKTLSRKTGAVHTYVTNTGLMATYGGQFTLTFVGTGGQSCMQDLYHSSG